MSQGIQGFESLLLRKSFAGARNARRRIRPQVGGSTCFRGRRGRRLAPARAPAGRLERVREVLRLAGDLSVAELHDADRRDRALVVEEHVLDDPQVTAAYRSPDLEASPGRVIPARLEHVPTAAEALAGLRVLELDVVAIDLALGGVVAGVGR